MTCLSAPAAGIVGFLEALRADEASDTHATQLRGLATDLEHLPACPHTGTSKSHRRGTRTASRFHRLLTTGARHVMRPLKIGVQSAAQDSSARSEETQGSGRHVICLQDIAYQMRCACRRTTDTASTASCTFSLEEMLESGSTPAPPGRGQSEVTAGVLGDHIGARDSRQKQTLPGFSFHAAAHRRHDVLTLESPNRLKRAALLARLGICLGGASQMAVSEGT